MEEKILLIGKLIQEGIEGDKAAYFEIKTN